MIGLRFKRAAKRRVTRWGNVLEPWCPVIAVALVAALLVLIYLS